MTAPDPVDVIEQTAKVLRAYLSTPTAIHAARALADAGLLADTADRDRNECPTCGCPTKCEEGLLERAEAERDDLAARAHKLVVEWYERAQYNESLGRAKDAWWRGFIVRQREAADELLFLLRGESK